MVQTENITMEDCFYFVLRVMNEEIVLDEMLSVMSHKNLELFEGTITFSRKMIDDKRRLWGLLNADAWRKMKDERMSSGVSIGK